MKKFLVFFIAMIMIIVSANLIACSPTSSDDKGYDDIKEYNEIMNTSIGVLKEGWEDFYSEQEIENRENKIKIANSRIVVINDTHEISEFQNIKNIIEFVVYSDYYGTQGKYYLNVGMYDTVLIYKDGTMELQARSIIQQYISVYYDTSFPFVSNVVELGSSYNQTINLNLK